MKKTKLIATLLVSSQVLLATPIVLADETATTQSIVPISGTVDSTVATDSSDSTTTTSSSERLQINAVAIGNALTKEQETYTLDKLGIKGETPIYKTSGTDLMSYIPDGGFTKDWAVYSSVRMQTLAEGEGITVDIATPENITRITAASIKMRC